MIYICISLLKSYLSHPASKTYPPTISCEFVLMESLSQFAEIASLVVSKLQA